MKKPSFLWPILTAALALTACRHDPPAPAKLILGFGGQATSAKSFTPEEIAVTSIKIEGAGPGGARVAASSTDFRPVELELVPGAWVITAKGLSATDVEVASGFIELSLGPSETLARDILLAPIAGEGSVSLSWTMSGGLDGALSVEGSLADSGGTALPIAAAFSAAPLRFEGLRNGSWTLELRLLRDGASVCGLADGVLVAAGMETRLSVSFEPPDASLSLGFVIPDYTALSFQVEPAQRRASRGVAQLFRAPVAGQPRWYAGGVALAATGPELSYAPSGASSVERIDCVLAGSSLPRSGSAEARVAPAQTLGSLAWGELVDKSLGGAAAQAAMRGLGDCRDLAWSAEGFLLAAAGKTSNALSLFEAPRPGAAFALASVGGSAEPGLVSPGCLRFLPGGSLLALSETAGAVYAIARNGSALSLARSLSDPCLAGAKDLAIPQAGPPAPGAAYVAASGADAVALVVLDSGGEPLSASPAAIKGGSDLATFSRPYCLALSPDGSLLAVGTAGDDAIYFFARNASTNALSFASRLDKTAFPAEAPLSDPCSLAFSPEGASLFVLSYYGKTLIRLDRDSGTGLFAPAASARSGQAGVSGFATPKRIALSPNGKLLAVVGGGTGDGLALFDAGAAARLDYKGTLLPGTGWAVPAKPSAAAFSPDGRVLALAADGYLSLFSVSED